jgi:hypothetical protein
MRLEGWSLISRMKFSPYMGYEGWKKDRQITCLRPDNLPVFIFFFVFFFTTGFSQYLQQPKDQPGL